MGVGFLAVGRPSMKWVEHTNTFFGRSFRCKARCHFSLSFSSLGILCRLNGTTQGQSLWKILLCSWQIDCFHVYNFFLLLVQRKTAHDSPPPLWYMFHGCNGGCVTWPIMSALSNYDVIAGKSRLYTPGAVIW